MRWFDFTAPWRSSERLARMRSGSGDSYAVIFGAAGTLVRAFDHESPISPWRPGGRLAEGILEGLPQALRPAIDDPAFRTEGARVTDLTFCAWRETNDAAWSAGPVADTGGAEWLLEVVLDGTPAAYSSHAEWYFSEEVDPTVVAAFYRHEPASPDLVLALNPLARSGFRPPRARADGLPRLITLRSARSRTGAGPPSSAPSSDEGAGQGGP